MKITIPQFSYELSRPITWKWYTPTVAVGSCILLIILSFLNFGLNGYVLELSETKNPNATKVESWPYNGLLSGFTKVQGSCQPIDLTVGTRFYTNQFGLLYTVIAMRMVQNNGSTEVVPTVKYLNNLLENCLPANLGFVFESSSRTASQLGGSEWGISASVGQFVYDVTLFGH